MRIARADLGSPAFAALLEEHLLAEARASGYRRVSLETGSMDYGRRLTGLSHRQSCGDIFAITVIQTLAVFVVIATCYLTA